MRKKRFSIAALVAGALLIGSVAPAVAYDSRKSAPDIFKVTGGKVASWYTALEGIEKTKFVHIKVNGQESYYANTGSSSARLTVKCLLADVPQVYEFDFDLENIVDHNWPLADGNVPYCDLVTEVNVKSIPGDLVDFGADKCVPAGVGKKERCTEDLNAALTNLETGPFTAPKSLWVRLVGV